MSSNINKYGGADITLTPVLSDDKDYVRETYQIGNSIIHNFRELKISRPTLSDRDVRNPFQSQSYAYGQPSIPYQDSYTVTPLSQARNPVQSQSYAYGQPSIRYQDARDNFQSQSYACGQPSNQYEDVRRPIQSASGVRRPIQSARGASKTVVSRGDEMTLKISIPTHWQEMRGRGILIADVNKGSFEWENVQLHFGKTLPKRIVLIKRIQNLHHWETYSLTKRKILKQNGKGYDNEVGLFHGTTPDLARIIENQNLDPRLSGKNGTFYGKGTYFAVEAKYSDGFAESNEEGHKFMFMARVLTGKFCQGDPVYRRPPQIDQSNPSSPFYDSCVDDIHDPKIFCIFHDSQFYIDYLIEYI